MKTPGWNWSLLDSKAPCYLLYTYTVEGGQQKSTFNDCSHTNLFMCLFATNPGQAKEKQYDTVFL